MCIIMRNVTEILYFLTRNDAKSTIDGRIKYVKNIIRIEKNKHIVSWSYKTRKGQKNSLVMNKKQKITTLRKQFVAKT